MSEELKAKRLDRTPRRRIDATRAKAAMERMVLHGVLVQCNNMCDENNAVDCAEVQDRNERNNTVGVIGVKR